MGLLLTKLDTLSPKDINKVINPQIITPANPDGPVTLSADKGSRSRYVYEHRANRHASESTSCEWEPGLGQVDQEEYSSWLRLISTKKRQESHARTHTQPHTRVSIYTHIQRHYQRALNT